MASSFQIAINGRLSRARDMKTVEDEVRKHLREFNLVNCTTALQKLARNAVHGATPDLGVLNSLVDAAANAMNDDVDHASSRQLASSLWACAKLRVRGDVLYETVVTLLPEKLQYFNGQELSNVLWAFARRYSLDQESLCGMEGVEEVLELLAQQCQWQIRNFTPQGVANVAWSFATMQLYHEGLMWDFKSLLCESIGQMRFKPQELANLIWAFGKLQVESCEDVLAALEKPISQQLLWFSPQQLSNILWAIAKLAENRACYKKKDILLKRVAKSLTETTAAKAKQLKREELSMSLWAVASLGFETVAASELVTRGTNAGREDPAVSSSVLSSFLDAVKAQSSALSAQQMSTVIWAFARLALRPHALVKEMLKSTTDGDNFRSFNMQDLSYTAWAMTRMAIRSKNAFRAMAARACDILSLSDDSRKTTVLPGHLAILMHAMAKLDLYEGELVEVIKRELRGPLIDSVNPRDITTIAWSLATMRLEEPGLMKALGKATLEKLESFNSQELLKFLWACDKCGCELSTELKERVEEQRTLSYSFPTAGETAEGDYDVNGDDVFAEDAVPSFTMLLDSKAPGRQCKGTGVAFWEASFVLADFIARNRHPNRIDEIKPWLSQMKTPAKWDSWEGLSAVELGAGLGLPSLVAAHVGMSKVVATDGDQDVIALLHANKEKNSSTSNTSALVVKELLWGVENALEEVGMEKVPDLLLAADVVYGNDEKVWKSLVNTMRQCSGPDTLILVAQVRRFEFAERKFLEFCSKAFDVLLLPLRLLHPDHQVTGPGSCSVYALREKEEAEESGIDASQGEPQVGTKRQREQSEQEESSMSEETQRVEKKRRKQHIKDQARESARKKKNKKAERKAWRKAEEKAERRAKRKAEKEAAKAAKKLEKKKAKKRQKEEEKRRAKEEKKAAKKRRK